MPKPSSNAARTSSQSALTSRATATVTWMSNEAALPTFDAADGVDLREDVADALFEVTHRAAGDTQLYLRFDPLGGSPDSAAAVRVGLAGAVRVPSSPDAPATGAASSDATRTTRGGRHTGRSHVSRRGNSANTPRGDRTKPVAPGCVENPGPRVTSVTRRAGCGEFHYRTPARRPTSRRWR